MVDGLALRVRAFTARAMESTQDERHHNRLVASVSRL